MLLGRRMFLAALSATVVATQAPAQAPQPLPILDTHQHLWDLEKFSLPWLQKGGVIGQSFVTADYLKAVEGLNVVQAVYMEVDVAADQKVAEAEYVLALTKNPKNLTTAAVIGGRPGAPGFRDYVAKYKDEPRVKGVRQVMNGVAEGALLDKALVRDLQYLGDINKSFDICTNPARLSEAARLVEACPDTRFILDHCGNGSVAAFREQQQKPIDQYRRDIDALAKQERVICKISGIAAQLADQDWGIEALAPVVNTCLDAFGPDRVVFASDWPVCLLGATYKEWVDGLKKIVSSRPVADQRKLFHDNAVKHYKL